MNTDRDDDASETSPFAAMNAFDIRRMTAEQLGALGVSQLAYVKPVIVNGARAFAIHGADGTPMAVANAADLAFAAIRQHEHEMVPALVH